MIIKIAVITVICGALVGASIYGMMKLLTAIEGLFKEDGNDD